MREFKIGDIVRIAEDESTLYVVLDSADFTNSNAVDIDYEIIQILPIRMISNRVTINQQHLSIYAKYGSRNNESLHRFIKNSRESMGLFGVPDFAVALLSNLKAERENADRNRIYTPNEKEVEFDLQATRDQYLDEMNYLEMFHNVFGDERYIEEREIVIEKLKQLK